MESHVASSLSLLCRGTAVKVISSNFRTSFPELRAMSGHSHTGWQAAAQTDCQTDFRQVCVCIPRVPPVLDPCPLPCISVPYRDICLSGSLSSNSFSSWLHCSCCSIHPSIPSSQTIPAQSSGPTFFSSYISSTQRHTHTQTYTGIHTDVYIHRHSHIQTYTQKHTDTDKYVYKHTQMNTCRHRHRRTHTYT